MRTKKPFRLAMEGKPSLERSSLAELHWKSQGRGKKSLSREAGVTTPKYTQLEDPSSRGRERRPLRDN